MNFSSVKRLITTISVIMIVSASFLFYVPNEVSATPRFSTPEIYPEYPNATEPVNITIDINDNQDITNVTLYYSYDGISWLSTDMNITVGGVDGVPFDEPFPTTTLDPSRWASTTGTPTINDIGINEPSPSYSLDLDGSTDGVTSVVIDLSSSSSVSINFSYEPGGGGNSPEDAV